MGVWWLRVVSGNCVCDVYVICWMFSSERGVNCCHASLTEQQIDYVLWLNVSVHNAKWITIYCTSLACSLFCPVPLCGNGTPA